MKKNEGVMFSINPITGDPVISKWKLPMDFRWSLVGWTQDFFRAIEEFGIIRILLLRLVLGRYGYSELVGMLDDLKKYGDWIPEVGYDLENMSYHKRNRKLEFTTLEEWHND